MAFWGVEVKPGKPFTHKFDEVKGRLHISMASLGFGSETTKSILQCNVGNKSPIYLCSLYPGSNESLQLNLEFQEAEDVILSVIGPRSIHLSGFFLRGRNSGINDDETESYGVDIANTETEGSLCSDKDDFEDSFINDDEVEAFPPSPISSGEVKVSAQKKTKRKKGSSRRRLVRKSHIIESDEEGCPEKEVAVIGCKVDHIEEDEDTCAISSLCKKRLDVMVPHLELGDKDDKGNNGNNSDVKAVENKCFAQINLKEHSTLSDVQKERETESMHIISFPLEGDIFENGDEDLEKKEEWKTVKKILNEINTDSGNIIELVSALEPESNDKDLVNVLPVENERNQKNTKTKMLECRKATPVLEGAAAADKAVGTKDKCQESVVMDDNITFNLNVDYEWQQKVINENCDLEHAVKLSHPSDVMGSQMNENKKKSKKRREREKSTASLDGDASSKDKSKENGAKVDVAVNPAEDGEEEKTIIIKEVDTGVLPHSDSKESKKKKKKRKTTEAEDNVNKDIPDPSAELKAVFMEKDENKVADTESSEVGVSLSELVEVIKTGKQNSKIAESGKKISVYYTGWLKSTGASFVSNVGDAPYKFRLGRNKVMKGWDVGLEGMRVGEKRRLTIPPPLGFGRQGDGENIPPNAWLVYEIELVKVH